MREAIGGTWIFQIVIAFIMLFTGFLCLSINRAKAFKVKDEIIQTIQYYNGIDLDTDIQSTPPNPVVSDIVDYIKNTAFRNTGTPGNLSSETCYDRNGRRFSSNSNKSKPVFCVEKVNTNIASELPDMAYYKVKVFYQLDLPIFGDLFNFTIVGDTKTMLGGVRTP